MQMLRHLTAHVQLLVTCHWQIVHKQTLRRKIDDLWWLHARVPQSAVVSTSACRVPQNSESIRYQHYLVPRLGDSSRLQSFIFRPETDDGNLITAPAIRDIFKLTAALQNVSTTVDGTRYSLQNVCWRAPAAERQNVCQMTGILNFFNGSEALFERVAAQGPPALERAVSTSVYPNGAEVSRQEVFPGAEVSSNDTIDRAVLSQMVRTLPPPAPPHSLSPPAACCSAQ